MNVEIYIMYAFIDNISFIEVNIGLCSIIFYKEILNLIATQCKSVFYIYLNI